MAAWVGSDAPSTESVRWTSIPPATDESSRTRWYDPITPDDDKRYNLEAGRIHHWLSVGAQPSETVAAILKKHGIDPKPGPHHKDLVDADEPATAEAAAE